jgi:hypothetical protein
MNCCSDVDETACFSGKMFKKKCFPCDDRLNEGWICAAIFKCMFFPSSRPVNLYASSMLVLHTQTAYVKAGKQKKEGVFKISAILFLLLFFSSTSLFPYYTFIWNHLLWGGGKTELL